MPHFDRYDVCEAWTLFLSDWHGGMSSPEYRAMSSLLRPGFFEPAPGLSRETLTENARDILASLIRRERAWLRGQGPSPVRQSR